MLSPEQCPMDQVVECQLCNRIFQSQACYDNHINTTRFVEKLEIALIASIKY